MSRPLLLGESPSRDSDPLTPFSGRSGDRLRALLGRELEDVFDVRNLLPAWAGPAGKGSLWPRIEARHAALALLPEIEGRRVVMCGRRVASAFGVRPDVPFLTWLPLDRYAVIPHPSGVVRWWNEPGNVEAAAGFLRALVE